MKIVQAIHGFPPFNRAGSENYAYVLACEQAQRNEVVVFHRVADVDRPEYEITRDKVGPLPVVRINRTFRDATGFEDTYRSDKVAAAFGRFLDEFGPDVVHFHHVTTLSTTCVHEAKRRGISVVFTLHDFWLLCPRGQLLRRDMSLCDQHETVDCVRCMGYQLPIRGGHERMQALEARATRLRRLQRIVGFEDDFHRRRASKPFQRDPIAIDAIRSRTRHVIETCSLIDRFVTPSQFLGDEFVKFGIPAEKITVSDNGFDLTPWQNPQRQEREKGAPLRVVYIGTWIPSKGIHILINAFRKISPKKAVLDAYGYGLPYDGFDDYEGDVKRLGEGCPHIRFPGAYEQKALPGILSNADALVIPSIWYENSPLTIHEAFLAGLPVIASDHGGMKEFVKDGVNGLTFEPGNARSLRKVLKRLASRPRLLKRLRKKVPAVKPIDENARELEEIYREVAGEPIQQRRDENNR